jgi:hypothetical protein
MINPTSKIDAVRVLYGEDSYNYCDGNGVVRWADGHETTEAETTAITAKYEELLVEYDALAWKRSREAEYPSLLELTVALYDTDDKSAVEAKRAAVKAKYPKPS